MRRFLAGLVVGVVLTVAAYQFRGGDPHDESAPRVEPVASSEQQRETAAGQRRGASEAEEGRDGRKPSPGEPVSNPVTGSLPGASGEATSLTTKEPPATSDRSERRDYSAYPPEIADILDTRNPKPLQTRYEAEDREDSWATYMEGQLAAYFAQKPELGQFNISQIDCRSSVCEIHAIGYGLDARTVWTTATADIIQQPWHEFRQMSMSTRDPQPGIFAVVLVLARKPE